MKNWLNYLLIPAIICILTGPCFAASEPPLKIFVSILPQKFLVERIGKDTVEVSVLVQPGESPATYEPTPRQIAALSSADLYISIGMPFEHSLVPRIAAATRGLRIVDGGTGVLRRTMTANDNPGYSDQDHVIETDGKAGHTDLMDPHIWLSPLCLQTQVSNISTVLSELRTNEAVMYANHSRALNAELAALHLEISDMLAPHAGAAFYIFHPVLGYFAHDYGLKQMAIEQSGKAPSPRQLAALIARARMENVGVIFVQREFNRKVAQSVADATDSCIVVLDPLAENIPANLRFIAGQLRASLDRSTLERAESGVSP